MATEGPSSSNRKFASWITGLCFAAFLGLGTFAIYTPPDSAWADPVSDAIEYVMGARSLVEAGRIEVSLNGSAYPSRYQPGFAVFFLAPIYQVAEWTGSKQHGLGIHAVFISTMISLAILWSLSQRILSGWAGSAAAFCTLAALLQTTYFWSRSREIMSDLPALMLGLLGLALFRRVQREARTIDFLYAGMVTGVAVSVRMTMLAICIPFGIVLLQRLPRLEWAKYIALGVPVLASLMGWLLYNAWAFGDPFVTGYQYWLRPPEYALALEHFLPNLYELTNPFLPFPWMRSPGQGFIGPVVLIAAVLTGCLCRIRCPRHWERTRFAVEYLAFAALPIFVFHLFYPFHTARFMLLLHCILMFLGVIWLTMLCERLPQWAFLAITILAALVAFESRVPPPELNGRSKLEIARAADQLLPKDAVFVSSMNGMYVQMTLLEGTDRQYIPMSDRTSFTYWKIGSGPRKRIYEFVAFEDPAQVRKHLEDGLRVFVQLTPRERSGESWREFQKGFRQADVWRVHQNGPSIAELHLPSADGA